MPHYDDEINKVELDEVPEGIVDLFTELSMLYTSEVQNPDRDIDHTSTPNSKPLFGGKYRDKRIAVLEYMVLTTAEKLMNVEHLKEILGDNFDQYFSEVQEPKPEALNLDG